MSNRLDLQRDLEMVLGSRNVYYQPPESIKLGYPCILYSLGGDDVKYADNRRYNSHKLYTLTVIDKNPDSTIGETLMNSFQYCRFNRSYPANGLNHFVYELYY